MTLFDKMKEAQSMSSEEPVPQSRFDRRVAPESDFEHVSMLDDERVENYIKLLRYLNAYTAPGEANSWIAGGALRDIERGEVPKDIDVFFRSEVAMEKACADIRRPESGLEAVLVEETDAVARFDTVIGRIDLVKLEYFESAARIVERFDFVCCAAVIDENGLVCRHREFSEEVDAHHLMINALPTPVATFWRIHRLKSRGWWMAHDEYENVLRRAVESPEGGGWMSGDVPPKGMPEWAIATWNALVQTTDRSKLTYVLKRSITDEGWTNEIESLARLAGGPLNRGDKLSDEAIKRAKRRRNAMVRAFIVSSYDNDEAERAAVRARIASEAST